MKVIKSYKYRIYPNTKQEIMLAKTFGCVRYYWNDLVATFNSYDAKLNRTPTFKTSTDLRNELDWINEVSAVALQQKAKDFDNTRRQYFSKSRKVKIGKLSFRKKGGSQSFRLNNQAFRLIDNRIHLQKVGRVKIIKHREIPADSKLLSVTISKNSSCQYFASINFETDQLSKSETGKDVGLDLGIKTFSTQSDGIEIGNPKYFSKNQAKLKRLQQHFARKTKGSNRREKCRLKIARLHQKIANQREWFLHNYSTQLVNNYDTIFIEDLAVSDMLESRLMSKQISDAGWSKFVGMLNYKAEWYGKTVHKVDRFYASSKTCSCGVKNTQLKLSDREWVCQSCGTIHDRDKLAAQNILKEGRRSLGDLTGVEMEVTKSEKRLKAMLL